MAHKYKFNIGDKVRLRRENRYNVNDTTLKVGDIVTISARKYSEGCQVYGFEEDKKKKGMAQWLNIHRNFELVTQKFKVGDRLKCVNERGYNFDKGEIITVSSTDIEPDGTLLYGFEEDNERVGKAHWRNVEDNFKLAKERKKPEPKLKPVDQYQVLADIFMG